MAAEVVTIEEAVVDRATTPAEVRELPERVVLALGAPPDMLPPAEPEGTPPPADMEPPGPPDMVLLLPPPVMLPPPLPPTLSSEATPPLEVSSPAGSTS